jgi:hypothetical protein
MFRQQSERNYILQLTTGSISETLRLSTLQLYSITTILWWSWCSVEMFRHVTAPIVIPMCLLPTLILTKKFL